jgi:RsiW-degrading membrane proteinase PrsW (M82 family)
MWVLLILILISALPVLAVLIWFWAVKYPLKPRWFLFSILSGIVSLFPAAVLQNSFPPMETGSLGMALFKIFVQIALTEEAGRFLALILLFWLGRRFGRLEEGAFSPSFAAATGLLAGFGFAVLETAYYGALNFRLALLRAITAAPLHGACGARVGLSVLRIKQEPVRGVLRFLSAVVLHGMFNFLIIRPGLSSIFSILIAFSALGSSLLTIRAKEEADGGW